MRALVSGIPLGCPLSCGRSPPPTLLGRSGRVMSCASMPFGLDCQTRWAPHMNRTTIALVVAKAVLGASLALGLRSRPARDSPRRRRQAYAREAGDDNCDGIVMEDESGWRCDRMGNFICGPLAFDAGADVGGHDSDRPHPSAGSNPVTLQTAVVD